MNPTIAVYNIFFLKKILYFYFKVNIFLNILLIKNENI